MKNKKRLDVVMVERGLALAVRKTYPITQAVTDLLDNDERAAKMRKNMKEHAHPDSTEKLCAFIIARAKEHEQAKELEALPL